MILLDPTAEDRPEPRPVAPRLPDLRGRRIGLLDNTKHNSDYFLEAVERELVRRFGGPVRAVRKKTYTQPAAPEVLTSLADCEAVVTAIGD